TAVSAAATDRRWLNRLEAWGIAKESLQDLVANDTPQLRRQIVRTVKIGSYWSVWMTVFKDYPEILREMIRAIPGTAVSCFDVNNNCAPVPRPANS
ncbi:MAG: hypothetical protein L6Q69_22415, partial [Zoogloea sp.]|nr:hypothetical protein [Zoogloea sp.]